MSETCVLSVLSAPALGAMSDFAPLDARSRALEDFTWPTDQRDSKSKQHVKNAAVSDLAKTLVTDSYGSPSSLRKLCWDTYNARLGGRSECEYRFGLWDLKVFDFELKKWLLSVDE